MVVTSEALWAGSVLVRVRKGKRVSLEEESKPRSKFSVWTVEQVAMDDKQMMQYVVNISNEWRTVSPEYVGSLIVKQLRETAEQNLSVPLHRAVMAVPAEFDEQQRNYTRTAAQLAGGIRSSY